MLTLLWVEPGKGGLQVERDGEWVDAPPVPGAFVVNIGELLEYATQGYLKATNHRVISPRYPDDRISVPFFFNPALDARLPIIELPAELAAEATGVTRTRPTRSTPSTARTRSSRGCARTPTWPRSTTPTSSRRGPRHPPTEPAADAGTPCRSCVLSRAASPSRRPNPRR